MNERKRTEEISAIASEWTPKDRKTKRIITRLENRDIENST